MNVEDCFSWRCICFFGFWSCEASGGGDMIATTDDDRSLSEFWGKLGPQEFRNRLSRSLNPKSKHRSVVSCASLPTVDPSSWPAERSNSCVVRWYKISSPFLLSLPTVLDPFYPAPVVATKRKVDDAWDPRQQNDSRRLTL